MPLAFKKEDFLVTAYFDYLTAVTTVRKVVKKFINRWLITFTFLSLLIIIINGQN